MKALMLSLMLLVMSSRACSAMELPDSYSGKIAALNFYPSGARFEFLIEPQGEDGTFEAYLPGAFSPESVKLLPRERLRGHQDGASHAHEVDTSSAGSPEGRTGRADPQSQHPYGASVIA